MSMHKSLATKGRLRRHRNVLSRTERILSLEAEEKWSEETGSVFSLPKVRVIRLKKSHAKTKEEKTAEGAEAAAAPGAAPATAASSTAPAAKEAKGAKDAKAAGKK